MKRKICTNKNKQQNKLRQNIESRSKSDGKYKMFTIFGSNANGILAKKESLVANIQNFQVGAFFLQETKVSRKGQIKIENYEIFEVVRPNCPTGGSILTGVHKNLHPVFICGGEEDIEILVVQAKIGYYNCQLINLYGPQEYEKIEERINLSST